VPGERRKHLRSGFTTGAAAAAATRAALELLLDGRAPEAVHVVLPADPPLEIAVHACRRMSENSAVGSVIKDAGDDPDVTYGAEIGSRVTWSADGNAATVTIRGGRGVGRVTRPGLEVPVGQPAINPGPRKMIRRTVLQLLTLRGRRGRVTAEIFVPRGEALARRTLNARLGIVGGLSILGTTGIVRPMSHEAYVAAIRAALSVARASGLRRAVLTTGRRSERLAQQHWPRLPAEAFVQIGDHFARAMEIAADLEFERVHLAIFFGKAVKMARGLPDTHARLSRLSLETPAQWVLEIDGDPVLARRVAHAHTAREAYAVIRDRCPEVIRKAGREVVQWAEAFGRHRVGVEVLVLDYP
jgi:cobalt-precorrin-5B (C1)-methyltransferase